MTPASPSEATPTPLRLPRGPLNGVDEGAGVPCVALHGAPGSHRDFRWLAPALTPHARLLRWDLPGYGDTPLALAPSPAATDRAALVLEAIEALQLPPAVLIGHSAGAFIAAHVARMAPDRVKGLVLLASPGPHPHPAVSRRRRIKIAATLLRVPLLRRALLPGLRRGFRRAGFSPDLSDTARVISVRTAAAMNFKAYRRALDGLIQPTMVVWSDDDPLIPPSSSEALAERVPPGPRLRFETGGHNPQKTMAVEVAEALISWLPTL